MEKRDGSNVGGHQHFPFATMVFKFPPISHVELSSLNAALRLGGRGRNFDHNIAFWLVLAEEEATGDVGNMVYPTVWVNPSQARVPSMAGSGWETDCLGLQWTQ